MIYFLTYFVSCAHSYVDVTGGSAPPDDSKAEPHSPTPLIDVHIATTRVGTQGKVSDCTRGDERVRAES